MFQIIERCAGQRCQLSPQWSITEMHEDVEPAGSSQSLDMASRIRHRNRRGSRHDSNNVIAPSEARTLKEEKGSDDSKISDTRQE